MINFFFESIHVLAMENIGDGETGQELGVCTASSQDLFSFMKQIQEIFDCVTSYKSLHLETRLYDYICSSVAMI